MTKYDKDYKKMTRIWQGLEENDKTMTRTIWIWQEYDKGFKRETRLWYGL